MGLQNSLDLNALLRYLTLLAAVLATLSFGLSYGDVGNQATYLPHALNFVDPDFLRNDWLVHETTPYHGSFRWVVLALAATGALDWATAFLNSFLIVLGLGAIFLILREVHRGSAWPSMMLVILAICIDRTETVGASYLFSDGLQPSVLAMTGWLFGIWVFLRGNYLLSGALLAVAGSFHANFLILGIGLFSLAHVLLGWNRLGTRWLQQVGPSLLVLSFSLPLILAAAGGEEAERAREIFLSIRAPHHYLPLTYLPQFWYLGGWTVCGLAAAVFMQDIAPRKPLLALLIALTISIAGATVLTTLVFIPQVSQLYVWRLAPVLLLLCQVSVAICLVRSLTDELSPAKRGPVFLMAAGAGALAILRWVLHAQGLSVELGVCLLFALVYAGLWFANRRLGIPVRQPAAMLGIAGMGVVLLATLPQIAHRYRESSLLHPAQDGLYSWARTTDRQAVFLVPPDLEDFRLLGQRAVVVDWKSTPIMPGELIDWYQRLTDVSGREVRNAKDAVSGYRSQDLLQLKKLASRFGADYIVVDKRSKLAGQGEQPIFADERFSVYASASASASVALGLPAE